MWKVNLALVNISIETCILIKPNKFKKKKKLKSSQSFICLLINSLFFSGFFISIFVVAIALLVVVSLFFLNFIFHSWRAFLS